jgi:hypothetical protein
MVGLFSRLKLRLMRNRLKRSGTWGLIGFIMIWLGAAGLGALLGVLGYGAGYVWGGEGLALVLSLVGLAWLVFRSSPRRWTKRSIPVGWSCFL